VLLGDTVARTQYSTVQHVSCVVVAPSFGECHKKTKQHIILASSINTTTARLLE